MEVDVAGGKHCTVDGCGEFDFLPLQCNACKETFCQRHIAYDSHSCTKADRESVQVFLCPICNASVRILSSEDPNVTWERHYSQDCPRKQSEKTKQKRCPVEGCREILSLSNRFECQLCNTTFCLKHRLQEDHPCITKSPSGDKATSRPTSAASVSTSGSASEESVKSTDSAAGYSSPSVAPGFFTSARNKASKARDKASMKADEMRKAAGSAASSAAKAADKAKANAESIKANAQMKKSEAKANAEIKKAEKKILELKEAFGLEVFAEMSRGDQDRTESCFQAFFQQISVEEERIAENKRILHQAMM